jgi:Rps23 Pro-64 3,4-dihydroxylase Tpa1-like proline 4-hydroxylase
MIQPHVLEKALDIQYQFQQAKPFKHVAIDNFLDEVTCESLLADFPAFDPERARNELGQIGAKAVNERVSAISSAYKSFYEYINSKPFLEQVSELTGIQDLIADATLFGGGTHENRDGQSLDVHIDFNVDERRMLHRRLNLLVYLNKEWDSAWGGDIELHSDPRNQIANQVTSFKPLFNRAVIFETNEYSWHGFRRIALPPDKKHLSRKSISVYLYTKDRPAEEVVAPHTTFYVAAPMPDNITAGHTLSEEDVTQLKILMASRDGLLGMYQNLLIEKEQRLRNFMRAHQDGLVDHNVILGSRSWRLLMTLHKIRYSIRHFFKRNGATK